jgi:hypothetical protein
MRDRLSHGQACSKPPCNRIHNNQPVLSIATMVVSSCSNGNGNGDGNNSTRRASRSRPSGSEDGVAVATRPSKSMRNIKYCDELLPRHLMCSCCILYQDASPKAKAAGSRDVTHTKEKYRCHQPWKMLNIKEKGSHYSLDNSNPWLEKIRAYLEAQGFSARMLRVAKDTPIAGPPVADTEEATVPMDLSPLTMSINSEDFGTIETDGRTVARSREEIELYTTILTSCGHEFVMPGLPITHIILSKNHHERMKNECQMLKELQGDMQGGRFKSGSILMKSLIAVAIRSCPALPLSQACNVIPMFIAAMLVDVGIIDRTKVSEFATSFPSETYLRDLVFNFAAENIYQLGARVKDTHVFLSCYKGNKKGVSHFVKILSWYDPKTTCVVKQLLDIDASGGFTDDCADDIAASLNKVGNIRLQGQTTDSGGGGVLDGLHRALEERQLCRPGYLVTSCSLHNLQLAVANPIGWLGEEERHAAPPHSLRSPRLYGPCGVKGSCGGSHCIPWKVRQ